MCRKRMMGEMVNYKYRLRHTVVARCHTKCIIHAFTLRVWRRCLRLLKQPHLVLAVGLYIVYLPRKIILQPSHCPLLPCYYIGRNCSLQLVLMDCASVPAPIIGKLHYFSLIFNESRPHLSCWLQIVKWNLGQGYREENNKNK